jgi:hypothetical protein
MWFSGLRGAIAFSLVLNMQVSLLPLHPPSSCAPSLVCVCECVCVCEGVGWGVWGRIFAFLDSDTDPPHTPPHTLAQSHSLTAVSPETKSVLVTTTLIIVLATIFIFGGGTAPMLEMVSLLPAASLSLPHTSADLSLKRQTKRRDKRHLS